MPRQARKESGTGIYHVMLRGINRQDIFEEAEDYMRMLSCLQQMLEQYDDQGNRLPPLCTFYAYCLMSNHVHLLLRVNQEDIGSTIKHLAVMYAIYYNQKYSRSGHVFQDRFKSEPVNDMQYFVTLLRYIHQNPVKAGIVEHVKDYEYSSWGEYDGTVEPVFQLCDTGTVLRRVPFDDLEAMVNEPLADEVNCLDMDDPSRSRPSDDQVWAYIKDKTGVTNSSAFQRLNDDIRRAVLKNLKEIGASHRQLARLMGIGRGVIQKL